MKKHTRNKCRCFQSRRCQLHQDSLDLGPVYIVLFGLNVILAYTRSVMQIYPSSS